MSLGGAAPSLLPSSVEEAVATVRRTNAAHVSALEALERTLGAVARQLAQDRETVETDRARLLNEVNAATERERADVRRERDEVARARSAVAVERARMVAASAGRSDEVVTLNVGGVRYESSVKTLTSVPDSMLAAMFGDRNMDLLRRDGDGSVFIDRDGARFRRLLDFLREPTSGALARDIRRAHPGSAARQAMVRELDFFGLQRAVFDTRSWIADAAFAPGPTLKSPRYWCAAAAVLPATTKKNLRFLMTSGDDDDDDGDRHRNDLVVVLGGFVDTALNTTEFLLVSDTGSPPLMTAKAGAKARETTTTTTTTTATSWREGPPLPTANYSLAAAALDDRRILVIGGRSSHNGAAMLRGTAILDSTTRLWAPGPDMAHERSGCAVASLGPGRLIVVGGTGRTGALASCEVLDVPSMTFSEGPELNRPRTGCAAVALGGEADGQVLVVGGRDGCRDLLDSTDVIDAASLAVTDGPRLRTPRHGCAATRVDATRVLVVGGKGADSHLAEASTEILDVAAMTTFSLGPTMTAARFGCAACTLGDERILVLGGASPDGGPLASTEWLAVPATTTGLDAGDDAKKSATRPSPPFFL